MVDLHPLLKVTYSLASSLSSSQEASPSSKTPGPESQPSPSTTQNMRILLRLHCHSQSKLANLVTSQPQAPPLPRSKSPLPCSSLYPALPLYQLSSSQSQASSNPIATTPVIEKSTYLVGYEALMAIPQTPASLVLLLLLIQMYPLCPQLVPHEFFTIQYGTPAEVVS